ncbi:MAG: prepilin peptidase [Clostridiales bacterium]|jgi:leader peptidase (prepilin peptidase)/N-methyltransferase|nr:prepilin peptidase [Eubacteriales bacterium]MDH7565257.1 prepilin peptidase [Clostridiales bacterium]
MIFLILCMGLIIGSFLNVCIYRIPLGESVVEPPSHCTNCGTRLKPVDLVPVLSFMFLKGKCRYCGAKVSARYPAVELITALVFMLLFSRYGLTVDFLAAIYLMSILIAVFFIDMDHKIIPDGLVLAGLAGGVLLTAYNIFNRVGIYGDRNWWNPLLGGVAGSGFLFLVALIGALAYKTDEAMGMGDVKIFLPIGMFLGWRMTVIALLLSIFAGGIASLFLILTRKKERRGTIPFGPFIATGTFMALMWGWDLLGWYVFRFY